MYIYIRCYIKISHYAVLVCIPIELNRFGNKNNSFVDKLNHKIKYHGGSRGNRTNSITKR